MRYMCLVGAVLAGGAVSAQPYSQSMAECGALASISADWVMNPDVQAVFALMEERFVSAAHLQAEREAIVDPGAMITAQFAAKKAEWASRGRWVVMSQDYEDWIDYCRSFARAHGIDLGT